MKLIILLEGQDGNFWGRIDHENALLVTSAPTKEEVVNNLKALVQYQIQNESAWQGIKLDDIEFEIKYDLTEVVSDFEQTYLGRAVSKYYALTGKAAHLVEKLRPIPNQPHAQKSISWLEVYGEMANIVKPFQAQYYD